MTKLDNFEEIDDFDQLAGLRQVLAKNRRAAATFFRIVTNSGLTSLSKARKGPEEVPRRVTRGGVQHQKEGLRATRNHARFANISHTPTPTPRNLSAARVGRFD